MLRYGQRFQLLASIWPVLLIFFLVIGGIYLGWFTPTEAAAIGAAGHGPHRILRGGFTRRTFVDSLLLTAKATGMIFLIILGAAALNNFLALSQLPQAAVGFVTAQGFNPWIVLILILVFYLMLGCFMDSLSMILLDHPDLLSDRIRARFRPLAGRVRALVRHPCADRCRGRANQPTRGDESVRHQLDGKGTSIGETFRGVTPFLVSDLVRTAILIVFPSISLFLVHWLY